MNGKINQWLCNLKMLEKGYTFYERKNIIRRISSRKNLIEAHIEKSDYNLEFVYFLLKNNQYFDWAVVGLYYSLYHASLSLLAKKGYTSKDHSATLCFLIKHFSEFSAQDFHLYSTLLLRKDEITFYTTLKKERQLASYATNQIFTKEYAEELQRKTISYTNKVKMILSQYN